MPKTNQNLKLSLIQALDQFFELGWAITPLLGNKAPYRDNWQHEEPLSRQEIINVISSGEYIHDKHKQGGSTRLHLVHAQGLGLRTGPVSGGIVAVDLDGPSAHPKLLKMSGGVDLLKTVAFTSGRPGRCQYIFRVPQQYWHGIQTKKFKCLVEDDNGEMVPVFGDDGKPEQVELRWSGCQSVLPPSVHPTTGQYHWVEGRAPWECEIAEAPLWLIEQMLAEPASATQPHAEPILSFQAGTSHNHCDRWSNRDWALSYLNALASYRADDYDQWLTVGMALHSVDDSLLSAWDKWSQQSPKYKIGICDKKWKSFKHTGVAVGSLAYMAKQDGWHSSFENQQRISNNNGHSSRCSPRGFGRGDRNDNNPSPSGAATSLVIQIQEILNRCETQSEQAIALMELASTTGRTYNEINQLAKIIRSEGEDATEVIAAVKSFQGILKSCRKRLDIGRYIERSLAEPLLKAAAAMPTAPEYLFNTLLPASASRIGTNARVVINLEGSYLQPCIFWTANVAHSGQAKTLPQQMLLKPLEEMEATAKELHDIQMEDYESDSDAKGKQPVRVRRLLNNVTSSTKIRIHDENQRGLLEYIDELVADYRRLNQYTNGKGDDLQLELSFWNGSGCNFDRHDSNPKNSHKARLFLKRTALSKTGTYQWDTLARLMADDVNFINSGYSARFLYCSITDAPPRYLDLLSPRSADTLKEKLQWLYGELERLPEADYLLSHEAKVLFQGWNHTLVNAEIEEEHFGLSLVYAKIESYTARIALWLHLVNAVLRGEKPLPVISGETMHSAIEIATFYLWQHKLIHAHNAPSRQLEGIFLKVQTQAEKFSAKCGQGVGASFLKTRINALKTWVVGKIRNSIFKTLAAAGHGRIEGEGSEMVYLPNTVSADFHHELVGVGGELVMPPIVQPYTNTDLQSSIGALGEKVNPVSISKQQEEVIELSSNYHQFTNSTAEIAIEQELEAVGDTTNCSPRAPRAPTAQKLAALILQCSTWVELVQGIGENASTLLAATKTMTQEERCGLPRLLATHLCQNPNYLSKLSWVPVKLRNKALEQLTFTIQQIGGVANSVVDACIEYVRGCKFAGVANLGTCHEQWIFQTPEGVKLPVFGVEAIEAHFHHTN